MKKKILATMLCVAMTAGCLAGCGGSSNAGSESKSDTTGTTTAATESAKADDGAASSGSGDEEVEFYMFISSPEYADSINELLTEYKKVKPNVTINYETTQNDYPTMLKAKLNSGECPDIFSSTAGKEIETYKEYSYDLSGQPVQEALLPAIQTSMQDADGNGCYGFHYVGDQYGIIYNQDCLDAAGITELPKTLDELEEIQRFRISSIEPNLLTDNIIHFVASSRRFMPHFHVPLQSGSNEVLHLMRRRYERELFAEKVQEIKTLIPDAFIGVDVIAGMRGETPEAFEDARQFIAGLDVSQLHVFPYSERSGTKALDIPYIVPQAEKHRRVNTLLDISEQKLHDFYTAHVGQTRPVLFEESDIAGSIGGFTDNYIRVEVPYDSSLANRIVPVELKTDIFGS